MTSQEYWEARQAWRMHAAMEDAEKTAKRIQKAYKKASDRLSREAKQIFTKFMTKYGLSQAEARRILNRVKNKNDINSLLQALEASGADADILAELESPGYAARLARLARLQRDIDATMGEVYKLENRQNRDFYVDLAKDAFNRSMFETQQMTGYGFSFSHVNRKHIDKLLSEPWSGEHFSRRIWKNTKRLAEELKDEMLVSLLTGRTDREAAHSIADKFDTGYMQARRLVRTEACRISNEMSMDAYEEAGIAKYRYLATLDLRTSQICRELDGKEFLVSERKPGTNCPPMHPWCRSTTISAPTAEELKTMKRRARDPETGRTYLVPASMTYWEWYKKFVEKSEPEEEQEETPVERPTTDYNDRAPWSDRKGIEWIAEKMGISREKAEDILHTLHDYFDDAYAVHNMVDKESADKIEEFLTSPNVPVYKGETYRGVSVNPTDTQSAKEVIESVIKSGTWKETGITSFTSDRRVPLMFADHKDRRADAIPVVLINENNKTGVPVGHLSQAEMQREVLYPARTTQKGFKIISYEVQKLRNGKDAYFIKIAEPEEAGKDNDIQFRTYDDPIREKIGSAYKSHPEEVRRIKEDLKQMGVELNEGGTNMSYGPSPTPGKPGMMNIDPEASYSAWLHEYRHVKDDEASGWKGILALMNKDEATKWEDAAYEEEIEFAKKLGYNKIAKRLEWLKGERRREINGKPKRKRNS